ncbi:MAG TPA: sigma-54 dependent transcriptional regulator [Thermodesulfovibrionales bacterium]|nr:sigma-54 dependent transcriptional regulator [Thermodesulfovibrionales bacterium]
MEKIALQTRDASLRKELTDALPKGTKVIEQVPDKETVCVFDDIDTMRPGSIREFGDWQYVIAVTKQKRTGPVMEAATFGAYEVMQRPLGRDAVARLLQELREFSEEIRDNLPLAPLPPTPTCAIVGHSPIIMDVCKKLARLSQVDAPVLITGETGTGKELIAESIAQLSSRFGKPFVVVNCAAVPENLLESELFGFEKGSFTGAVASKEGMLKIADEGCVFFDEVGELPLPLQAKLLRFLQTQTFYPIGSTRELQVNVRVLSATNRNLGAMVRQGLFREDLYHRLSVTTIHIPPLRERRKDILPLVQFFLNRYKHTARQQVKGFTKQFLKRLVGHEWPGNIRELENTVRSALALAKTPYLTTHELRELGSHAVAEAQFEETEHLAPSVMSYVKHALENREKNIYDKVHQEVDKALFSFVLTHARENQSEAARLLGISRLTLRKKLLHG